MRAARKPLAVHAVSDIGIGGGEVERAAVRRTRERLFVPVKDARCELIEGTTESAQAATLAQRLRQARLI
jgi:hypothetical protein